jgi:hypothetical protein
LDSGALAPSSGLRRLAGREVSGRCWHRQMMGGSAEQDSGESCSIQDSIILENNLTVNGVLWRKIYSAARRRVQTSGQTRSKWKRFSEKIMLK